MTWRVERGDCVDVMRTLESGSVDAVVCDPPYAIDFMSKAWDRIDGEAIDPGFCHWLAGFADGEGCFSVHRMVARGHETYACQFQISLRADDRPILERIQKTLGIGTLSSPRAHVGGDGNPKARYSVTSKRDCLALREVFRAFPLRAKKAVDFETWSHALDEWVDHEYGDDWDEVAEQRQRLMRDRSYKPEGVRVDPFQMWCWRWSREAMRVLKPGGHLLAFGGTRTYHRLASGIEDAGFEIRDCLAWMYGTGFPKSLDVSKAIDKAAGAERLVVGFEDRRSAFDGVARSSEGHSNEYGSITNKGVVPITGPATAEAARWRGWGTALKPAYEPIVVARKPLDGTVAQTVLKHGTGVLNVDGCRISGADAEKFQTNELGRWPANVLFDEDAAAMLDEQSGESVSRVGQPRSAVSGRGWGMTATGSEHDDSGGASRSASRFMYTAKASSTEREAGLVDFDLAWVDELRKEESAGRASPRAGAGRSSPRSNIHPTVKPIDLMRWLVRLVCPPGGMVLDPFTGSGSTGAAAVLEGFQFVGIEREDEYAEIAEARIRFWAQHPTNLPIESAFEAERSRRRARDVGQAELF